MSEVLSESEFRPDILATRRLTTDVFEVGLRKSAKNDVHERRKQVVKTEMNQFRGEFVIVNAISYARHFFQTIPDGIDLRRSLSWSQEYRDYRRHQEPLLLTGFEAVALPRDRYIEFRGINEDGNLAEFAEVVEYDKFQLLDYAYWEDLMDLAGVERQEA